MKTRRNKRIHANQTRTLLMHPYIRKESKNVWVKNKINHIDKYPRWKHIQTGGEKKQIEKNGYIFVYDDNGDTILCTPRNPYKGTCFKIEFDERSGTIGVDISYNEDCTYNKELPRSHGTHIMLGVILQLIFDHESIHKYKTIMITDNSSVDCISFLDNSTHKLRLMDVYYVSTGCTWYSSLAPMFLQMQIDEEKFMKGREKILSSFSWNEFVNELSKEVQDVINYVIQFDKKETRNMPAHEVLNKIREERYHCALFHQYIDEFLRAFDAESLRSKIWCIPIRNGCVIASKEDILTCSCKHPKSGWIVPDSAIEYVSLNEYQTIKKSIQQQKYILDLTMNSDVKIFKY